MTAFLRCACVLLAFGTLIAFARAPAAAQPTGDVGFALDARPLPLGGTMPQSDLWRAYVAHFVTAEGRVVDTANGNISHSEGQGYGMLLAVAFGDRATFDRIWNWTRANLMVRNDSLLAWRWDPNSRPAVSDMNDAADGDILVAWSLTEAAEFWNDVPYRVAARRLAVEIGRKLVVERPGKPPLLLPGVAGFAPENGESAIVNLSYWVFPALARLGLVAPEFNWSGLAQGGLDLLSEARFGATRLPSDWVETTTGDTLRPADGFPALFAYNAIRIPLYMAWAGIGERAQYEPFVDWTNREDDLLEAVDVNDGRGAGSLSEPGYRAVAAILRCVSARTAFPADLRTAQIDENYYPATLRLLALVAAQMRYPSCLAG